MNSHLHMTGLVEGYASADSYFDVTDPDSSVEAVDTVLTEDRFKNEDGAADTAKSQAKDFGYVTVGEPYMKSYNI